MNGTSEKIRTFVAVFPSDEAREQLAQLQQGLRRQLGTRVIRWTDPGQIHLTTQFLGAIEASRVPEYKAAMERACAISAPFSLRIEGVGCFPALARPRIVWAGLVGDLPVLEGLKKALDQELSPLGFVPEERPFHPHLTLGRVGEMNAAERRRVGEVITLLRATRLSGWKTDRIELMKSVLLPAGASYSVLETFPLGLDPSNR